MKKFLLSIALVFNLYLNFGFAQQDVVNGDFEFWDTIPGTNGLEDPMGWNSNNLGLATCTSNVFIPGISKSTDAYSGSYSLKISPSNYGSNPPDNQVEIGQTSGVCTYFGCFSRACAPLPVPSYRHSKVCGYYKYFPDPLVWDTVRLDYYQGYFNTGSGQIEILSFEDKNFQPASNWTYFEITVNYWYPSFQAVEFLLGISFFSANLSSAPEAYFLLDSLAIVPDLTTELTEHSKLSPVRLSPNPADEILTISSIEPLNNYEIMDLRGSIVMSGKFSNTLDLTYLNKGIYFVRFQGKERTVVEKFVKE